MLQTLEKGISEKNFEEVLNSLPEWLKENKRKAWETFNNLSVDNNRREKFKDIIESLEIDTKSTENSLSLPENVEVKNFWGNTDAFHAYNSNESSLSEYLAKKGVIFKSLKKALIENENLVKPYLTKSNLTSKDSRFTALAEALWNDGTFLYVPKDIEVSLPIHLLKWTDKGGNQNYYKNLVIVENGSNLTVIDEITSENTDDFFLISGVNELHVKDNAKVTYLHLQTLDYNAFNFSLQKAVLGKDSYLKLLSVSMGSQFSYENIRTYMEQSGSNTEIYGLVIGNKEQVFQHETLQYHPVPSATSNLHFEVILKEKAESAHNGFVQIEKVAQQSDARQLIRNLLLSRKAKAEAIPNLEILADDVKCAHGVSLGPVNNEELFYLMARGFSQTEAENIIIQGHIEDILNELQGIEISQDEDLISDSLSEDDDIEEVENLASRVKEYIFKHLSFK